MNLILITIILSVGIAFSVSLWIVSAYLVKSNDYGNDFGIMYDVIQSSLKITEQKDKVPRP